jgi:hypothetical protein
MAADDFPGRFVHAGEVVPWPEDLQIGQQLVASFPYWSRASQGGSFSGRLWASISRWLAALLARNGNFIFNCAEATGRSLTARPRLLA